MRPFARYLPTVLWAVLFLSCSDGATGPAERGIRTPANPDLPHLIRGVGAAPVLRVGGTAPEIPPTFRAPAPDIKAAVTGAGAASVAAPATTSHIILENQSSGARALWVVSNGSIVNSASLGTVPTSWHVVGAGDYNADGFEDIIWDNTGSGGDGTRAVWLMNGSGGVLAAVNLGVLSTDWHIAGGGDYNADGKDDILLENIVTGVRAIWLMNGGQVTNVIVIGTLPDWHMVAARDLNSDGKADILLENPITGNKVLWMMSGGGVIGNVLLGTMPLEWKLSATLDIDGDGHNDILLENTSTGARAAWLENGFGGVTGAPLLTFLAADWHMATALVPDRAALKPNLTIDGMYLVQSVQTYGGSVPLVKDRDALLRIFFKADRPNSIKANVRVRTFLNGVPQLNVTFAVASNSVPTSIDESDGHASLNVILVGTRVQPGLSVLADIDPTNAVAETNESDNQFPLNGVPLPLDVRATPALKIMMVPVLQSTTGLQGGVTVANAATFVDLAARIHPFATYDAQVRAAYTTSAPALDPVGTQWVVVLNELAALQAAEGHTEYNYYGFVKVSYTSGVVGLAGLGGKAAMGVDWADEGPPTLAHEIAHNWNRLHSPCGNPAQVDPAYPYPDGTIGAFGVDLKNSLIYFPQNHDVMSYCEPYWISAYTFQGIMNYRATASLPRTVSPRLTETFDPVLQGTSRQSMSIQTFGKATGTTGSTVSLAGSLASGGGEPCLIVWGRVTPTGVVLEPSFETLTSPKLPERAGRYRITGRDASGGSVVDLSFAPQEVPDQPGAKIFAFAIPERSFPLSRLKSMRVTGDGRSVEIVAGSAAGSSSDSSIVVVDKPGRRSELRWNPRTFPLLVVRDRQIHSILSLARGGLVPIAAPSSAIEVSASDRIRTRIRPLVKR